MPSRILGFLIKIASRQVIVLLMVIFMILSMVVFPAVSRRLTELSGGTGMIDMLTGYTPSQVFGMVAAYGEDGRSLYTLSSLTADTLFPLDYALLFALILTATYRRAFPRGRLLRVLALAPFLAGGFDLLENLGVVTLLAAYPQQPVLVAQVTGLFTTFKWSALVITVILLLVCGVGLITHTTRRSVGK